MTTDIRAALEGLVDAVKYSHTSDMRRKRIGSIGMKAGLIAAVEAARLALAEPKPPVEGEVAGLVACLRETAAKLDDDWYHASARIMRRAADLLERLAPQPVPEGPSDAELLKVAATVIAPYESCGIPVGEYEAETESAVEAYGSELIAFARAVLARWGHPATLAPQPVPVSERSPEVTDCDALGRCWCYGEGGDMFGWTCIEPSEFYYYSATHWLPFTALPLPTVGHAPNA